MTDFKTYLLEAKQQSRQRTKRVRIGFGGSKTTETDRPLSDDEARKFLRQVRNDLVGDSDTSNKRKKFEASVSWQSQKVKKAQPRTEGVIKPIKASSMKAIIKPSIRKALIKPSIKKAVIKPLKPSITRRRKTSR